MFYPLIKIIGTSVATYISGRLIETGFKAWFRKRSRDKISEGDENTKAGRLGSKGGKNIKEGDD